MPRLLEACVEVGLDGLPDRVPVRPDDHGAYRMDVCVWGDVIERVPVLVPDDPDAG